jgi:hypothetical protein
MVTEKSLERSSLAGSYEYITHFSTWIFGAVVFK